MTATDGTRMLAPLRDTDTDLAPLPAGPLISRGRSQRRVRRAGTATAAVAAFAMVGGAAATVVQRSGDELKLVWPQPGIDPAELENWDFAHRLLQPMEGPEGATEAAMALVMQRPAWRLSLQTHKMLGIR